MEGAPLRHFAKTQDQRQVPTRARRRPWMNIVMTRCPTAVNKADLFTKAMPGPVFMAARAAVGVKARGNAHAAEDCTRNHQVSMRT